MRIMGIDSSTKTGVAVLEDDKLLFSGIIQAPKLKRWDRWASMAGQLEKLLKTYTPELVVFEGYGFANKHTLALLVEVGTVLRYFVWQMGYPTIEVPPNTLKKFVTGKGQAKKELMMLDVFKRWGFDCATNDEADAIGLAFFGLGFKGFKLNLPRVNLEAVDIYCLSFQRGTIKTSSNF